MKQLILVSAIVLASPAVAQEQSKPNQDIVVTGQRLSDTRKALEECLKRKCPPDEDINASLAHAENLFVAGEYQEARKTAKDSISRNDRHAKNYPVPVSDLYRANSRISAHLGEGNDYESSTWGIKRALRAGLPDDDLRLLAADLEVAGMQASLNQIEAARITYNKVEKRALKAGRPDLASTARLREAWLSYLEGDQALARRKLKPIAEDQTPGTKVSRLAAMLLLARLDRKEGKAASADALIAQLKDIGFEKPTLLYSPPLNLNPRGSPESESGSTTRLMAMDSFEDKWVDVGFWVRPDGLVEDVEILRENGNAEWMKPVLKSIKGRIYSPMKKGNDEGSYRVERYSYTSLWGDRTGTRIRQRSADERVEFLDLTAEPGPTK